MQRRRRTNATTTARLLAEHAEARTNRQHLIVARTGGETIYHQGFGQYPANCETAIRHGREEHVLRDKAIELAQAAPTEGTEGPSPRRPSPPR